MTRRLLAGLAATLAILAVVLTLLPLSASNAWWVRMWEFPRLHIAIGAALAGLLALALPRGPRGATITAMALVTGWQLSWVWPYMPWAREDVAVTEGEGVVLVALNVLQGNKDHAAVSDFIDRTDPDILLLMETDATWAEALAPVLDRYPTRAERIADDHYGMILVTRLDTTRAEMVLMSDDRTPAGLTEMTVDGHPFTFIGLHPRPPVPQTNTEERDRQIAAAARLARRDGVPTIAAGDFNDVAWSRAAQKFREIGEYRDPRAGRGIQASFDVTNPLLRFPIDQGLITDGVILHDFRLGPPVGSDHLAVIMEFSISPPGVSPAES